MKMLLQLSCPFSSSQKKKKIHILNPNKLYRLILHFVPYALPTGDKQDDFQQFGKHWNK